MDRPKRLRFLATVVPTVVLLDQLTKVYAERALEGHPPISLLGDTVRFVYMRNYGAFLSLGAGMSEGARTALFVGIVGLFVVAMSVHLVRSKDMVGVEAAALTCVVAGGIGNLIDRVWFGYVRDFANVGVGPVRTGVFNIADVSITLGAILMLWYVFGTRSSAREKAGKAE